MQGVHQGRQVWQGAAAGGPSRRTVVLAKTAQNFWKVSANDETLFDTAGCSSGAPRGGKEQFPEPTHQAFQENQHRDLLL